MDKPKQQRPQVQGQQAQQKKPMSAQSGQTPGTYSSKNTDVRRFDPKAGNQPIVDKDSDEDTKKKRATDRDE